MGFSNRKKKAKQSVAGPYDTSCLLCPGKTFSPNEACSYWGNCARSEEGTDGGDGCCYMWPEKRMGRCDTLTSADEALWLNTCKGEVLIEGGPGAPAAPDAQTGTTGRFPGGKIQLQNGFVWDQNDRSNGKLIKSQTNPLTCADLYARCPCAYTRNPNTNNNGGYQVECSPNLPPQDKGYPPFFVLDESTGVKYCQMNSNGDIPEDLPLTGYFYVCPNGWAGNWDADSDYFPEQCKSEVEPP